MMFKVFVNTKKAVPGLAKILLLVILLGAIGFAWFVQREKLHVSALELDRQISIDVHSGRLAFKVSSDWKKLDKEYLSTNMLMGWKVEEGKTNIRFYVGVLKSSDIVGRLRVFSAVRLFFPSEDVLVEPEFVKSESDELPACVGSGAIIVSGRLVPLYLRVMYLPDGECFVMIFMGSGIHNNAFAVWDRQIADTIKFDADREIVRKVLSGEKIVLGPIVFKVTNVSWIVRDKNFDIVRLQPVVEDSSKLWVAKIKSMRLPGYRKPDELLAGHFVTFRNLDKTINIHKDNINKKFVMYKGRDSDIVTIAREKYEYVELCWAGKAKTGEAILVSVNCEGGCEQLADSQMKQLLQSVSLNVNNKAAKDTKKIDVIRELRTRNLARQSAKIAGWYLAKLDSEPIGFESLMYSTFSRNKRIRIAGLDYSYYNNGVIRYTQRESWELFADNLVGKYSSKVDLVNLSSGTSKLHSIVSESKFLSNRVQTIVRIDGRVKESEFDRPKEFLPSGGELFLLATMAERNWHFGDKILCAQTDMLGTQLKSVVYMRIKRENGTDILVMSDNELSYCRYKFDKDGRWIGMEIGDGLQVKRVNERKIARLYRRRAGEAVRYFFEMEKIIAGED